MDELSRRPRKPKTRQEARDNQRWRLLQSMAHLVGKRGYASTSIAQVIERAGVSRKTFYEYFPDKETCFLAAYEELSERFIRSLADEEDQLASYLEILSADLTLARAFILEVLQAGASALEVRERVNARFADLVFSGTSNHAVVRRAITGGVNDVVHGALLEGSKDLRPLLPALRRFVDR